MKNIHKSRIDGFFLSIIWLFVLLTQFISFGIALALLVPVTLLWLFNFDEDNYEYKQSKRNEHANF